MLSDNSSIHTHSSVQVVRLCAYVYLLVCIYDVRMYMIIDNWLHWPFYDPLTHPFTYSATTLFLHHHTSPHHKKSSKRKPRRSLPPSLPVNISIHLPTHPPTHLPCPHSIIHLYIPTSPQLPMHRTKSGQKGNQRNRYHHHLPSVYHRRGRSPHPLRCTRRRGTGDF